MRPPVRPHIGAPVPAASANHAPAKRSDRRVSVEALTAHDHMVVAANGGAVDEQVVTTVAAMWPIVTGGKVSRATAMAEHKRKCPGWLGGTARGQGLALP